MNDSNAKALLVVGWSARAIVAGVFLWAAVPKLMDAHAFAQAIDNYRVLPTEYVGFVALVVPVTEVVASVGLCTPWLRRGSALTIAGLLLVFIAAMGQALWRGIDLDCGCFGEGQTSTVSWWSVARNVGLLGLLALAAPRDLSRRWPRAAR